MIPRWFVRTVQTMVSIVAMVSIFVLPVMFLQNQGWVQDASVYLDINGMLDEMLGLLPGIGSIIQSVMTAFGAYDAVVAVEVSVYDEVLYALLLFCAYQLLDRINSIVQMLFSTVQEETSWFDWLCKVYVKVTEILCAVLLANLVKRLGNRLLFVVGVRNSTWILLGIIVVFIFLVLFISKRQGVFAAAIDTLAEMVIGMIVVCLIYIAVVCLKIMQLTETATAMEMILSISGLIGSMLALELIESTIAAKGLSGFLSRHF